MCLVGLDVFVILGWMSGSSEGGWDGMETFVGLGVDIGVTGGYTWWGGERGLGKNLLELVR